ncbi:hypothetical protein EDC04DRAFT_2604219 [Pisolithus marmoratus]|nr:hypothetical protein EDC04DRAFT_2604219 [Pisolithus marmoratus]
MTGIYVYVTGEGESSVGNGSYSVDPQQADAWARQHTQVCVAYQEDDKTEIHMVTPGRFRDAMVTVSKEGGNRPRLPHFSHLSLLLTERSRRPKLISSLARREARYVDAKSCHPKDNQWVNRVIIPVRHRMDSEVRHGYSTRVNLLQSVSSEGQSWVLSCCKLEAPIEGRFLVGDVKGGGKRRTSFDEFVTVSFIHLEHQSWKRAKDTCIRLRTEYCCTGNRTGHPLHGIDGVRLPKTSIVALHPAYGKRLKR